jgi:predicted transcriptional regulator
LFDFKKYGSLARERRHEKGISEKALREEVRRLLSHVERDFIDRVERGERKVTLEQFFTLNYLLWDTPLPTNIVLGCVSGELRMKEV